MQILKSKKKKKKPPKWGHEVTSGWAPAGLQLEGQVGGWGCWPDGVSEWRLDHGWRERWWVLARWGLRVKARPRLAWRWGPSCGRTAAADQSRVFPGEPARSLPRMGFGWCSHRGQAWEGQARTWGGCVQDADSWMSYSGVRHCVIELSATRWQFCVVGKKNWF